MTYSSDSFEARLLVGDAEAVARVSRWVAAILTLPRFWCLNREWRDLHQESMTSVIQSLREGRFDPSRDLRVYVQGIARNISLQRLRERRAQEDRTLENPNSREEADPERRMLRQQLVRRVLELASAECRELIVGYFLSQRSYEEIARDLEVPVGTVKSRMFRCLESAYRAVEGTRSPRPHLVKNS
jgi:RNA polymerase sigma-70 factor, ECF subfamily